jgi:ABC-type polysaccharide/polyol phosphate export permease
MNRQSAPASARRYWPLGQLVLARLREFYREPEAIFWVYGFPILIVIALGIAFRNKPVDQVTVDVVQNSHAQFVLDALRDPEKFKVEVNDQPSCRVRLRTAKADLVVVPGPGERPTFEYLFDKTRPESVLARNTVDDALERAAGRRDLLDAYDQGIAEPGSRYIDFLVPGLLGMSLMGGGLWGVGFATVDMRVRKLLKRFLATPMRKSDFLAGIIVSRLVFMVPEVALVLLFAWLVFGVVIRGSLWMVALFILLGAFTFAGVGLLMASRARTLETVSGLMNLVMLPMWVLSGIFFSSERFPESAQPFIRALPLTPLINGLRAVMLEGAGIVLVWPQVLTLAAWGSVTFLLALRWFRWT